MLQVQPLFQMVRTFNLLQTHYLLLLSADREGVAVAAQPLK